jgi:hypothetical protein
MCTQHQRLLDEETGAWAAWRNLKDRMPPQPTAEQTEELSRLAGNAANASYVLKAHLSACLECSKHRAAARP